MKFLGLLNSASYNAITPAGTLEFNKYKSYLLISIHYIYPSNPGQSVGTTCSVKQIFIGD